MAAKTNKTRVTLPGSLADLVKDLQAGGAQGAREAQQEETRKQDNFAQDEAETQQVDNEMDATHASSSQLPSAEADANANAPVETSDGTMVKDDGAESRANKPIGGEKPREDGDNEGQKRGRPQKENTMKTYQIQKDDSADSWDLFLDLAKQYKTGGGRPATIYIDPTLKSILDRMKYPLSLTTSSILSSIVARFIYDHEEDVRKALFSQNIF